MDGTPGGISNGALDGTADGALDGTLKDVRITVVRVARYEDLIARWEAWEPDPCTMREGLVFVSRNANRPDGMCESAWETLRPFVEALAAGTQGSRGFYDGWMKDPASACLSCNDGFRPVSFLVEAIDAQRDRARIHAVYYA